MRIGIDISQVVYGTGVSRYTKNLVENLVSLYPGNQYALFSSSLRNNVKDFLKIKTNKTVVLKQYKFPPTFLQVLWNRLHVLDIERFIGKVDVYHTSDWLEPPANTRKITTVHDVSFLRFPKAFPKKIISNHKRKLSWVKKESDLILADSNATKNDLVNLLNFNADKIEVVYLGVEKRFFTNNSQKVAKVKEKYGIANNYILSVGTLEPRKNLKRVLDSFRQLKKQQKNKNLQLVLVGKMGWGENIKNSFHELPENSVILTGFVDDENLPSIYAGAKCFVYPSLYEGFGLPVLEAMASSCPVVTSNTSSLAEITNKAAVTINPENTDQITQGINSVLENNNMSQKLIVSGKKQANLFTWKKTCQKTMNAYKKVTKL